MVQRDAAHEAVQPKLGYSKKGNRHRTGVAVVSFLICMLTEYPRKWNVTARYIPSPPFGWCSRTASLALSGIPAKYTIICAGGQVNTRGITIFLDTSTVLRYSEIRKPIFFKSYPGGNPYAL